MEACTPRRVTNVLDRGQGCLELKLYSPNGRILSYRIRADLCAILNDVAIEVDGRHLREEDCGCPREEPRRAIVD